MIAGPRRMAALTLGAAFAMLLTVLLAPALAQAKPGDLDTSFGAGGEVRTHFSNALAFSVAIDSRGRVVVAGSAANGFALARYRPNGKLDSSFGGDGKVTTQFKRAAGAYSVTIDSKGRIVAAGTGRVHGALGFAVARYRTNGRLDRSFGADGKVTTPFRVDAGASSVAIDSRDRVIVSGSTGVDFALARYRNDGHLDRSFSTNGKVTTGFGGEFARAGASSVAIDPRQRIVAVGVTYDADGLSPSEFALARYKPNGSLDASFGGGEVTTGFGEGAGASSAAIDSGGRIVAAGDSFNGSSVDFALARYKQNGDLDAAFGTVGRVTTDFGGDESAGSVAIDSRGRIVSEGTGRIHGGDRSFALARYRQNGGLDPSFGVGGKVTVGAERGLSFGEMGIDSRDRIVIVGGSEGQFLLVRLLG